MKKINILLIGLLIFLVGNNKVNANSYYCNKESAAQLAKIIYREVGADTAANKDEAFFMRINTAAIVINNAKNKTGDTFYSKLYNLTDSNYENYSTYKDKSLESVIPSNRIGEFLYIAELVLTQKYTFPTNMTLQANEEIVTKYGDVWAVVSSIEGYYDIYFGYEHNKLNNEDIFGNIISDTSVNYYKNLASSYEKHDYSQYTLNTVCKGINSSTSNNNSGNTTSSSNKSTNVKVCENPDILRVIYFGMLIIDIVKIIIPIALIVLGIIDLSKSVVTSDEKVQKKSFQLLGKRILYAIIVFTVPWIIEVLMITLGNTLGKEGTTNFTDCLENANGERIEQLEQEISKMEEMQKTCTSTTFLIRYYDADKNVVLDSISACTNQQIKFKSISKPGYTFKGWDFKYKSIGKEAFTTNMPYVISDDFLKSIEEKYGGFNLIPVWE